jgi:hypothetical protein
MELIQFGNPSRKGIENSLHHTCELTTSVGPLLSSNAAKVKLPTFPISLGRRGLAIDRRGEWLNRQTKGARIAQVVAPINPDSLAGTGLIKPRRPLN